MVAHCHIYQVFFTLKTGMYVVSLLSLLENLCLMGVHFISKSSHMDLDSVIYFDFSSRSNLSGV